MLHRGPRPIPAHHLEMEVTSLPVLSSLSVFSEIDSSLFSQPTTTIAQNINSTSLSDRAERIHKYIPYSNSHPNIFPVNISRVAPKYSVESGFLLAVAAPLTTSKRSHEMGVVAAK